MSSGNLILPENSKPFLWTDGLDRSSHIFVTYRVTTTCDPQKAAIGMAMEQSASTLRIKGYVSPKMVSDWTIRIYRVEPGGGETSEQTVPPYFLNTEVYTGEQEQSTRSPFFDITLAVPLRLIQNKPAQLLNVLVGELPRLGFLTSFRIMDIELPKGFGPGPSFGARGILKLLDKSRGPILCRAMRPGVGLDTSVMADLNRDVLTNGFHLVKDDELICFEDHEKFTNHLRAMIRARDQAMSATGEKKLYIANLICEPHELAPRFETACELGADAALVSPFIQGLGVLSWIASKSRIPVLSHNSFADLLTRHPQWGIDDAALCTLMRHLGADWFVTPGTFCSSAMNQTSVERLQRAASDDRCGIPATMPNVQGGKHPEGLHQYIENVGHRDFMLIVANWVDSYPSGLKTAAKIFRDAVDALDGNL